MKNMNPVQMSYHFNANLVKETAKFLTSRDICSLSMVSRIYYKHMKRMDYLFKEESYSYFCSEYESYNIKLMVKHDSQLSSSSIILQNAKRATNEKAVPYNYTWKGLLTLGMYIKEAWDLFSHNQRLHDDLIVIRDIIYSDLLECRTIPKLRKTQSYVENDFNSPLQIFLYDFLYEQQDLYEDYDKVITTSLSVFGHRTGLSCKREDIPFAYLIQDFRVIKTTIKTEEDKKRLQYARWYYCIDEPDVKEKQEDVNETLLLSNQIGEQTLQNDSIIVKSNIKLKDSEDILEESKSTVLSTKLVQEQLATESNPIFYTLKCLYLTLTFYCQYTMRFLYTTYRNPFHPKKLLHEYLKRYKNYIETAKNLNSKLENLNVCINYLYEEFFPVMPAFPKFSILRLCMIIWNKELTSYVDQYETMLSSLKLALTSVYSKQMSKEIKELFSTPNKDSFMPQIKEMDNGWSMIDVSRMPTRSTLSSSPNKTILNVNKSLRKDTNTHNVIIEQMLSTISDMFSNEYSVFYMNSTNIITNNIYTEIEGNFCDLIEGQLRRLHKKRVLKEKLTTSKMVEEIISYFSSSFYSESILNKMRIRLYRTVKDVLIDIISDSILKNFEKYLDGNSLGLMKEFQARDYFLMNDNPYRCIKIYKVLLNTLNDSIIPFIVREYLVMNYLSLFSPEQAKDLQSLQDIEKWYIDEEEKAFKTNKQINKELDRKQLPTEFDKYQRLLLSMSIRPTWNTVQEVQRLESKYDQMEVDECLLGLSVE